MSNPFIKIIPLALVAAMFVIGIPFIIATMGAFDSGVDMTNSSYSDQYNATTDTSIAALGLLEPVPLVIGVVILIMGVLFLKQVRK